MLPLTSLAQIGAKGRSRTNNNLFTGQALYQLSYFGLFKDLAESRGIEPPSLRSHGFRGRLAHQCAGTLRFR
jgi:hypothetical protein